MFFHVLVYEYKYLHIYILWQVVGDMFGNDCCLFFNQGCSKIQKHRHHRKSETGGASMTNQPVHQVGVKRYTRRKPRSTNMCDSNSNRAFRAWIGCQKAHFHEFTIYIYVLFIIVDYVVVDY